MLKIKQIIKISGIVGVSILIILISEVIYIVNNRHDYMSYFYLWAANKVADYNPQKSLSLINLSALNAAYINKELIDDKMPGYKGFDVKNIYMNDKFISEYKYFNPKVKFDEITKKPFVIAKDYYLLGLLAYKNGENELADSLFEAAVYTDPELSYYAIEYANLNLTLGNIIKSKNILDNCMKFVPPKLHCSEYLQNNYNSTTPLKVGYFEYKIKSSHKF